MRNAKVARTLNPNISELDKLKVDIINFKMSSKKYRRKRWLKSGTGEREKMTMDYVIARELDVSAEEFVSLAFVLYTAMSNNWDYPENCFLPDEKEEDETIEKNEDVFTW